MAGTQSLYPLLIRHLPIQAARRLQPTEELEKNLQNLSSQARTSWPTVQLDDEAFMRHLAERLAPADPLGSLRLLHVADLYLACACQRRQPKAVAALEKTYFDEVGRTVARMDSTGALADEVKQVLLERLLVPPSGEPRIGTYSGRGPLAGWLCAAAIRTALSLQRQVARELALDDAELLALPSWHPELEFLRFRYGDTFRATFRRAVASLTSQERNVLRFNVIDGLNIEEIGATYQVHRATVARWIARARQQILERTRQYLREDTGLQNSEVDSLIRLLDSQLEVSVARLLREPSG